MTRNQLRARLVALAVLMSPEGDEEYTATLRHVHKGRTDRPTLWDLDLVALVNKLSAQIAAASRPQLCQVLGARDVRPLGYYLGAPALGACYGHWELRDEGWTLVQQYATPVEFVDALLSEPLIEPEPPPVEIKRGHLTLLRV